ncbi:hypothetical protein ACVWWQ_001914 [Rhodanobacter sp. TND4EL1]
MTKRLATCLAAAALLAAFHVTHAAETRRPAPFPAQTAPDIRGLKLGMTQKDVTAIFPHAKCSPAGCIVRPVSFGGTPNAALAAYLANGKTVRIDAILLSPETFDQLITLVEARLGPSTDDPACPPTTNTRHGSASTGSWTPSVLMTKCFPACPWSTRRTLATKATTRPPKPRRNFEPENQASSRRTRPQTDLRHLPRSEYCAQTMTDV